MITDNIKSWSEDDRPREKLILKGAQALSDSELIAILLSTGTKSKSAVTIAKEVLALTEGNLDSLGRLGIKNLTKISGVGQAKAVTISAALELGRRRQSSTAKDVFTCSKDIFQYIGPMLYDLNHEEFWVITLNKALGVTGKMKMSSGGYDQVSVDIRMVMKFALEQNAVAIVLAHNHPSGSLKPSKQDDQLTDSIKEACKLLNIKLIDHMIVCGPDYYYSYADEKSSFQY